MKSCESTDRPLSPHQRTHQYEVSILRGSIFGREFEDVPLLNELISRVNDILFSSKQLIHLQQLSHALLGYMHTKHGCTSFYGQLLHPTKFAHMGTYFSHVKSLEIMEQLNH